MLYVYEKVYVKRYKNYNNYTNIYFFFDFFASLDFIP